MNWRRIYLIGLMSWIVGVWLVIQFYGIEVLQNSVIYRLTVIFWLVPSICGVVYYLLFWQPESEIPKHEEW